MKERIYLDYNSTSPFSNKLINKLKSDLEKGDFAFANPSSMHESGKRARKEINQARAFIGKLFGLNEDQFSLVFNSGSTESIRTFFEAAKPGDGAFFCQSDHPAVHSAIELLRSRGIYCEAMPIDADGNLDVEAAIVAIKKFKRDGGGDVFLNYLTLHNETGVHWPLSDALAIKKATGAFVHVDATQLPGKHPDWRKLEQGLDAYTFSGHKFGSLKGIGFSFWRNNFKYVPLMKGGGQQGAARGGTENALGIVSIKVALQELDEHDPYLLDIKKLRDELEEIIKDDPRFIIVGAKAKHGRGVNTLNFLIKAKKADIALIQFDMAGLEVSSGSACSAGSVEPSKTLVAMGFKDYAKNGIRVSLGSANLEKAQEIKSRFSNIVSKL